MTTRFTLRALWSLTCAIFIVVCIVRIFDRRVSGFDAIGLIRGAK